MLLGRKAEPPVCLGHDHWMLVVPGLLEPTALHSILMLLSELITSVVSPRWGLLTPFLSVLFSLRIYVLTSEFLGSKCYFKTVSLCCVSGNTLN